MKKVVFEGVEHQFPDDATEQEITSFLGDQSNPTKEKKTSKGQEVVKKAYEMARKGLSIPLATARTIDQNLGFSKYNKSFKENLQDVSAGTLPSGEQNLLSKVLYGGMTDPAMYATMGMSAPITATKYLPKLGQLAKEGLKQGLVSAGIHQGEMYGNTGEVSPLGAGIETSLSVASPALTGTIAEGMKGLGKEVLGSSLKVKDYLKKSINPPDIDYAMKQNIPSYFGGPKKMLEKLEQKTAQYANTKDNLGQEAGIRIDYASVFDKVRKNLESKIGKKGGLSYDDYSNALKYENEFKATAVNGVPQIKGDYLEGNEFRKFADDRANFIDESRKLPTPEATYYRELRNVLDDEITNKVTKNLDPNLAKKFIDSKENLAKVVPLKKATQDMKYRKDNTYSRVGLIQGGGAGIGATIGGFSGDENERLKNALTYGAIGYGATNLFSTPGGAKMLYDAGRGLNSEFVRRGMPSLMRSTGYEVNR